MDDSYLFTEFVLTPSDAEVDAGSTFVWNCTATGQPTPVITWQVDGAELLPGYLEHVSVLANNSLLIRGVKPEDAGHYQCHASNGVGVHVVQAKLRVRGKKRFSISYFKDQCCFKSSNSEHLSKLTYEI